MRGADVRYMLDSGLLIAAMPVTFAGWDGEQPPDWMAFDVMLYGFLGVVATAVFSR